MCMVDYLMRIARIHRNKNITPEWISELKPDEIFVFGCRRSGRHY